MKSKLTICVLVVLSASTIIASTQGPTGVLEQASWRGGLAGHWSLADPQPFASGLSAIKTACGLIN